MTLPAPTIRVAARSSASDLAWRLLPALPFVLVAWIGYWNAFRPPPATLPSVTAVVETVIALATDGQLGSNVLASLWRLFLGATVGIVTGILGGFVAGLYRNVSDFLNPLVVF